MPTANPLRPLLRDRAYDQLKALIVADEFPPGSFLSERKLADRLGMSKTPIKSALALLEKEGFVKVSPQQGIVVREITPREIVDMFDVRISLESFLVRRLAGQLQQDQIDALQANLDSQRAAVGSDDRDTFNTLDAEFHLVLAECGRNREILDVMRRIRDRVFQMALSVVRRSSDRFAESFEEHTQIVDALVEGDGAAAARTMERHLEGGKHYLLTNG